MKYLKCPNCKKKGISLRSAFSDVFIAQGDSWYECKYCKKQFEKKEIKEVLR